MQMTKSITVRLVIVALCVAAPQAAIWQLNRSTSLAADQAAKFDVAGLPMQLGEWSGTVIESDPRLVETIGAISLLDRSYTNAAGHRAYVHLASHATADLTALPHSPNNCYRVHGWTIADDNWQTGRNDRRYRWMTAELSEARVGVAYWYQVGSEVVSDRDEMRKVYQKLRRQGQGWPPVVKVMIHIPFEFAEVDSQSATEELGAGIYEWIRANT
jgi:EpsI family protein